MGKGLRIFHKNFRLFLRIIFTSTEKYAIMENTDGKYARKFPYKRNDFEKD